MVSLKKLPSSKTGDTCKRGNKSTIPVQSEPEEIKIPTSPISKDQVEKVVFSVLRKIVEDHRTRAINEQVSYDSSIRSTAPIVELNIEKKYPALPSYSFTRTISTISLNSADTEYFDCEEVLIPDQPIDSNNVGVSSLFISQDQLDKAFRSLAEEFLEEQKRSKASDVITPKTEQLISLMVISSMKNYMKEWTKKSEQ
mmetsp:Transcript_4599/g.6806  ORF Transcript_4599/g.6806 Transcript_4599/m.6806 type:complete len:198 (+) Transcript_4599:64-657(+)|eukprot:CAMPEP_0172416550 /NCGR_PEP_ID=MMETSP1064-20121228/3054_1 /TAXON_ID=202472 /ORGANISM="Aulacoseira subarctica , Strain CCAP 1002/5" /LENGTH=197 /DNA_ID=CAMNT_0013154307 /DNA_START=56 /DNA_END=649 /DNA_ORIENTATION=-